jgi:hypothetical protein
MQAKTQQESSTVKQRESRPSPDTESAAASSVSADVVLLLRNYKSQGIFLQLQKSSKATI